MSATDIIQNQQDEVEEKPADVEQSPQPTPDPLSVSPSMPSISKKLVLGGMNKSPSQASMIQVRQGNMLIQYKDMRNPLEKMSHLAMQKKHKENLQKINKKGAQEMLKSNQQTVNLKQQINNNKKAAHELKTTRANQLMEKDNQLLLRKLVEISLGKRSTIPSVKNSSSNQRISIYPGLQKTNSLESLEESKVAPKTSRNVTTQRSSLNNHTKLRELRRIEQENAKIAYKIMSIKPSVRALEHQKDFEAHQSISEGLRRIKKKKIPVYEGKQGTLPPIQIYNDEITEQPLIEDTQDSVRRSQDNRESVRKSQQSLHKSTQDLPVSQNSKKIQSQQSKKSRYSSTIRSIKVEKKMNEVPKHLVTLKKNFEKQKSPYRGGGLKEFQTARNNKNDPLDAKISEINIDTPEKVEEPNPENN